MSVEVQPGRTLKHDGVLYKAGEIIHNLAEAVKAELVKVGVVKDLDAVAGQTEQDAKALAATAAQDANQLERDAVGGQVASQAKADVQAAIDTLNAPGTQVTPSGQEVPASPTPAATPPAPTNEEVAATAAQVE